MCAGHSLADSEGKSEHSLVTQQTNCFMHFAVCTWITKYLLIVHLHFTAFKTLCISILIRLWESKYSPLRLGALYELVCVSVLRLYGARKTKAWWIVHLCSTTLLQTHPTASTDTHMCTHSPVRRLSHLEGVMGVRSFPMVWMTRRPHTHRPAQMPIPP